MTDTSYDLLKERLKRETYTWLITGVAGFIGSNLLEALLKLNQKVVGLDNFSTGHQANLDDVRRCVGEVLWSNFLMIGGDICDLGTCVSATQGVDYVLHHAAVGSVPHSIENPIFTNKNNVDGFLNILVASSDNKSKRLVYASSSSVYGDGKESIKTEENTGEALSPYGVSKRVDELYASVFSTVYGAKTVGLRYFNVFGPRQDPDGNYAAVVPKWIKLLMLGEPTQINGDGKTTRDFCFVYNVIQANILAALNETKVSSIYNIATGDVTTLAQLHQIITADLAKKVAAMTFSTPTYKPPLTGDIRHSVADINSVKANLGYLPSHSLVQGINLTVDWFLKRHGIN